MKQTILTTKQSELLEELIATHGQIVTTGQIYQKLQASTDQKQAKKIIAKLVSNGWLIRIQRGLYAISDLSNRGFLSLSPYVVANLLFQNSYVSFESALNYQGIFDQLTNKIISVTTTKHKNKTIDLNSIEYSSVTVQKRWFFGWEETVIDGKSVRIAIAEKALIDIVQFRKSKYSVDLVIEKLRDNKGNISLDRLQEYLQHMSATTIKTFGFVFDLLGINSSQLQNILKNKRGTDWMLAGDQKFNAKWRLYYDEYFDKYQIS